MKQVFSLLLIALIYGISTAQCVIDNNNTAFFSPSPDSIPCVERGLPYDQVIQIKVPSSIDLADCGAPISFVLTVDSLVITNISGFPNGLTYIQNPASGVLYGGENGCGRVQGTTNDPVGNYPLAFTGFITLHGFPFPGVFDGDTTIDLATLQSLSDMFNLSLDVINQGDPCRLSSVADNSGILNAQMNVYPNPATDAVVVKLNTGSLLEGKMTLTDMTGRTLIKENISTGTDTEFKFDVSGYVPGLYNINVLTSKGNISKRVSIQ